MMIITEVSHDNKAAWVSLPSIFLFLTIPNSDLSYLPENERAKKNFDHPDSLETELLAKHVRLLKEGKSIEGPTYDFATFCRAPDKTETKRPQKIILLEGILIFTCPELLKEIDIKVFVDAAADIRLTRRIGRDTTERGRTVQQVLDQYHHTVRPMHDKFVEPSKKEADLVVDTSSEHSMKIAIKCLSNHLKVEAGMVKT